MLFFKRTTPSSPTWTLDFEPAFSPRFSPTLSPRSIFSHWSAVFTHLEPTIHFFPLVSGFHPPWADDPFFPTGQRFSPTLSLRSIFFHWSAVSHSKTRDFRFPWAHDPFFSTGQRVPTPEMIWRHPFALDQSEASIFSQRAPFTTHSTCEEKVSEFHFYISLESVSVYCFSLSYAFFFAERTLLDVVDC